MVRLRSRFAHKESLEKSTSGQNTLLLPNLKLHSTIVLYNIRKHLEETIFSKDFKEQVRDVTKLKIDNFLKKF